MWTSLLLLAPPALAAAGTHGQGPPSPPEDAGYVLTVLAPDGDFTRSDWGDFDGDGQEDFVFLSGPRLDILFAPGIYEALVADVANPHYEGHLTKDFAVVREGGKDRIALIDETGLVILEVDPAATPMFVARTELGGFADATRLDTWDDGAGRHWAAGIHASGATLYRASDTTGIWSLEPGVPTLSPMPAKDIVLFDADGLGDAPELAFMAASVAFAVLDPWGNDPTWYDINPMVTYSDVTRVRRGDSGSVTNCLAVLGTCGGLPVLFTWEDETIGNFQYLPGSSELYAVSSGRWNLDPLDDLVLAGKADEELYVITDKASDVNAPPVFDFDLASSHRYEAPPGAAAAQNALPMIADIDHDEDGDLLFALEDDVVVWVGLGDVYPEEQMRISYDLDAYGEGIGALFNEELGSLHVRVTLPAGWRGQYLDVIGWEVDEPATRVSHASITSQRIPPVAHGNTYDITIPIADALETDGDWENRIYLMFQGVDAPDIDAPQTHCYPARGIVMVPLAQADWSPPHVPTVEFEVKFGNPYAFSQGGSQAGSGNDFNCVPSNRPPER